MPLDLLPACIFTGPALPEPFVRLELEQALTKAGLLSKTTGAEGKELQESWERYERKLRELVVRGGPERVFNHVFQPLVERLGYARVEDGGTVRTSLESEDGGRVLVAEDGTRLRLWATDLEADLDAPGRRGSASRYSPLRIAQRVLLAQRERVGLLTNGVELRLIISDPARTDSQVIIPIDTLWRRHYRAAPDSYRLLLALASPAGLRKLPDLIEQARLQQTRVTNDLRRQAREAIEGFIQAILDGSENQQRIATYGDRAALARALWREGLVVVYRLLVILKLAASDDPARRFSFADSSIWRLTYAPGTALAPVARAVLDEGAETGRMLEDGLRQLFRLFAEGVESQELTVKPLAGGLFDPVATPTLSELRWGERAVALLLDRLLWTPRGKGSSARERVSYAALDVEDLGRVYEALLELEPGIAAEPMCRLRRQKLEVVVPLAQGEKYHAVAPAALASDTDTDDADEEEDDEAPARGKKTKVEWVEQIAPGHFYLRVGLGRKSSGSYYTPRSFVRFLVQETVGPQCDERSPEGDPQPGRILALRLLDPSMGSGHFLVEACRFLGDRLYEACRRCDELASEAEEQARKLRDTNPAEATRLDARAEELRRRVEALPDPDNALVAYLPSRAREGDLPGLSEQKARALCRRLAAIHCIYGVDKNPLAVALARVALWIESHAEGLPLTFLDHRLVLGDSLTGPFAEHLFRYPGSQKPLDDLFNQGLQAELGKQLADALRHIAALEESVGIDVADIERKRAAKEQLDGALAPFRLLAAAWAGGVMLGKQGCDDEAYAMLARWVAGVPEGDDDTMPESLRRMVARGLGLRELPPQVISVGDAMVLLGPSIRVPGWLRSAGADSMNPALPYDLAFPEVFYPTGKSGKRAGFDVVVTNPPWDRMLPADKEFFASYEFAVLDAPTKREREAIEKRITSNPEAATAHAEYIEEFRGAERSIEILYKYQIVEINGEKTIGKQDAFRAFMERNAQVLGPTGLTGVVVPSAFHANEGATGVRRLYFEQMATRCCYSFENRNKLFEIDSRFKFAPVVASREGPTTEFPCAFYLHDDSWLFERNGREPLRYSLNFVQRTGGDYLSLLELRSPEDAEVARICFANSEPFGRVCERVGIRLGRELNMTDDAWRFTPTSEVLLNGEDPRDPDVAATLREQGYLVLHEGKTFHQFTDRWEDRPRYLVHSSRIAERADWIQYTPFYRLAFREIASSTNERTSIFLVLPPGSTFGNKAPNERQLSRPNANALGLSAVANTYSFDFLLRQKVQATINLFILLSVPLPAFLTSDTQHLTSFLAHSALRLTCNHAGYAALWREQVGEAWREERAPFDWPVLAGDGARWAARAAIDAVVAEAYGLSREQYVHVLSTFSHKSYPKAPELCLTAFDELKAIGLEAFTKKQDPYWDIPLNESLPEPVIELPLPEGIANRGEGTGQRPGRRAAKVVDEAQPVYVSPQLTLDLGEDSAPSQQVIDFAAAAAARRGSAQKAAEEPAGYQVQPASLFGAEESVEADGLSALDRHVIFLARAVQKHRGTRFERTLGHVKAEKLAHLAEAHLGLDFGRQAVRDAAGPVDFPHLKRVLKRGKEIGAFDDIPQREGSEGYQLIPLAALSKTAGRIEEAFGERATSIDALITDLMGLTSRQIEAIATLYAAWNDLLLTGENPSDERIFEQFWAWHPNKATFQLGELRTWIAWMRDAQLEPSGKAKPTLSRVLATTPAKEVAGTASTGDAGYEQVKLLLQQQGMLTNSAVQTALNVNATAARALLKRLVDEGLARQEGEKRGARYVKV